MDSSRLNEEYSYIGDKGHIGFIDLENSRSLCNYNPSEESDEVHISVPFPLVNGKPRSGFVGETTSDSVAIKNKTNEPLELWSVSIYDSKPENRFTISLMRPPNANFDLEYIEDFVEAFTLEDRILRPHQSLTIWLSCKPTEIGLHSAAIHFTVGDDTFERLVFVLAEDKISSSLSSAKPYVRDRQKKKQNVVNVHEPNDWYVVGRRPTKNSRGKYRFRLANYPIPANIREMVNDKKIPDEVHEGLTRKTYGSFFKTLLAMEEIKLEEDMRSYDMEYVSMGSKRNQYLSLVVPGLAEKRPSLVNGDYIFAKLATEDDSETAYQGFIYRVEAEEIYLKFDRDFHRRHREYNLYNVQFTYNRTGMRRLYQAVEAAESLDRNFLFPILPSKTRYQPTPFVPISCNLNEEQTSAIEMILSSKGGPPYLIHGPPGTGKTMTLVEAILQIYSTKMNSRILVCAPSNNAADHILERLIGVKSEIIQRYDVFRLNALTRPFEDINPDLIEFCNVKDFIFQCPSKDDIVRYRIIISTYASASVLYTEGVKRGHFAYMFLDEAGKASEPETMVPISNLYDNDTVVVLAGDPMQMGPVVVSKDAENYGLGTSYLERLFDCALYASANKNFLTKLVRNYRAHEAIIRLPSELFYDGELVPCKEENTSFSTLWDDFIPKNDFPLLFIGVQGCDEREGGNPSWFNRIEASKVLEIIRILTDEKDVKDEDIGVITPYRQQVCKIRGALESFGRAHIKVGSVEQFQGQEREVIILSTVRSTVKHNEFDRVHYLGFLSNPRRFNVAITRAKSLLVIIGNPHILYKDPLWNKLLWYCVDNGSYKGCFLPEREVSKAEEPSKGKRGEEDEKWDPIEAQWGEKGNKWDEEGHNRDLTEDRRGVEVYHNQSSDELPWAEADINFQPSDAPWE